MRLIYLLDQCTSEGGVQRVVSLKANYLVNKGYEIYVVSATKPEERDKTFFDWDSRIEFIYIGFDSIKMKYKKQIIQNLSKIFNEVKPDIVVSTGLRSFKYAASIKDGSKKVIEYHYAQYKRNNGLPALENSWAGRQILKLIFLKNYLPARKFDRVIVLTEEDKKSRMVHPFRKINVINNPITLDIQQPSPVTSKRIIAIGRIEKQKAFHELIQIWGKVEKDYPDWMLTIYGQGSEQPKIEGLIKDLNLERVRIESPTSQIKDKILNSSILCMTSRNEGLPLVLLESFACGVPAITYDFKCGPRDVITNGVNGFYSKTGDHESFIHNLKLLMNDESLRKKMGKAAYEESRKYKLEQTMSKWITLFDELMREKNSDK